MSFKFAPFLGGFKELISWLSRCPLLSHFSGRLEPISCHTDSTAYPRSNASAQITSRFCEHRLVACQLVTQTAERHSKTGKAKIGRMTGIPLSHVSFSHHYSSSESSSSSSSSSAGTLRRLLRDDTVALLAVCLVGFVLRADLSPAPSP